MAEEIVGVKIKVGSQGFENIKDLRKGLKEANDELLKAQTNFGNTSEQAQAAARRVAEFRDTIQEARETADLFDPGKKFQALTGTLSTVAGGFSAVQGAIGLVGAESEDVEKALLRVQSALALSQGLSTIAGGAKDFQGLGAIIKTQVVTAFSTLRGAIIATGLGALAVGLGLVAANFEKVKEVVLNLIPGLGRLASFIGNAVEKFTDFVGITSQAERNLDALEKKTKRGNEAIDQRIKILSAQGGKEKEIFELSKKQGENELTFLREKLKTKGKLTDEELKQFRDLKVQQQVLDAQERKRLDDEAKEASKKQSDAAKAAAEKRKKEQEERAAAEKEAAQKLSQLRGEIEVLGIQDELEAKKKAINNALAAEIKQVQDNEKIKSDTKTALIKALNDKASAEIAAAEKEKADKQAEKDQEALKKRLEDERAIRAGELQARIELINKENAAIEFDFEQDLERLADKRELLAEQEMIELENTELTEFQKFEIKKKYADARNEVTRQELETERAAQQAKIDLNNRYLELAGQFGGILQQIAGKNKALAIAGVVVEQAASIGRIISNTGVANAKAVAASPTTFGQPFVAINTISAGLSIASSVAAGLKAVQQINAAQPGGGGGASPVSASGGLAPISPAAPITNTVTQLDQQSINQMGSAATPAYVIESDVTNKQERIRRINRAARLI